MSKKRAVAQRGIVWRSHNMARKSFSGLWKPQRPGYGDQIRNVEGGRHG
jgi:hypothetical protein